MNTVELASRILTQLGFYQEPSKELGIDDRRDNIVQLIEEYTHPAKTLTDEEILLCRELVINDDELDVYDDEIASERFAIAMVRAALRRVQEK